MRKIALFGVLFCAALLCPALPGAELAAAEALERRVKGIVDGKHVTLVHFWAPWCGNCRAEMAGGGWANFVAANPEVRVVFINVWHRGMDPAAKLREGGMAAADNLLLLDHPNPASKSGERLEKFLDLPITWIPTTWIFREGRLRFAFNYGEVRFDLVQTLVNDSKSAWKH